MRWLRLYDDTINEPKVLKLPEATRWHWIALLCVASKNDGVLPHLDDIAIQLRVTAAKATEIISVLVKAGLLDKIDTGYAPHNWNGRQYKADVTDPTAPQRMKRYRANKRNDRNGTVTAIRPETEADTDTDKPEANASGAVAPPDPSIAEREYFARGREVLGKSAGGMLANLLKAKGGNVALARSAIETASTKQNRSEYVGAMIRSPLAKPLTEHQQKQNELKGILNDLDNFAAGSSGSYQENPRALRYDPSERPPAIRGRPPGDLVDISPGSSRQGG